MTFLDDRAAYVAGLRQLASLLERHEEIPLPTSGSVSPIYIPFLGEGKQRLDAVKALIGGEYEYWVHEGHAYWETRAPGVLLSLMLGAPSGPEVTP